MHRAGAAERRKRDLTGLPGGDLRRGVENDPLIEPARHAEDRAAVHLPDHLRAEHRQSLVPLVEALVPAAAQHRVGRARPDVERSGLQHLLDPRQRRPERRAGGVERVRTAAFRRRVRRLPAERRVDERERAQHDRAQNGSANGQHGAPEYQVFNSRN